MRATRNHSPIRGGIIGISIESTDSTGIQYIILDAENIQWSSHYGEEGGGFGYLRYTLRRKVGVAHNDIGFGYRQIVRKYSTMILFDGQIRQIEESSSESGDIIKVTALGWAVVAEDDDLLRAFCDKRLAKWHPPSEIPGHVFRPDQFATGSNAVGLYISASTQSTITNAYTEIRYDFFPGEIAERIRLDLSMSLGSGVNWDGRVSSTGVGTVVWKDATDETYIANDMELFNLTQNQAVNIDSFDTGTNTFTVTGTISSWVADDEITIFGPRFKSKVVGVSGAVVDYDDAFGFGESLIANGDTLVNVNKKSVATISSFSTAGDTITATDATHVADWQLEDIIIIASPMFLSDVSSVASDVVTYGPTIIGERVVSTATGWVLHNTTADEWATVQSWNIASSQVTVTAAGDVSSWSAGNDLRIYAAYTVEILKQKGRIITMIWPTSDWREGSKFRNRTAIDILTNTGSPTTFILRLKNYLGGSGDETSFAQFSNVRVYSTTETIDVTMLGIYTVQQLSAAGHDLNSDETDIATISHIIEPMVYEFSTFKEAMSQAASYGDGSLSPIAWGIRLDDKKKMYVEVQDRTTISYIIRRSGPIQASASGDAQESLQKVRAVYSDKLGEQQITAYVEDTTAHFSGHFRAQSVRIENADTDTEATDLITLFLQENKSPQISSKYSAKDGATFGPHGVPIPFDEVQATGKLVRIEDWRSIETGDSTRIRDSWTTEQLVAVEVNYDQKSVNLVPGSAKKTFERYMAELSRLASL